jgi:hypothetical protein
VGSFSYKVYRLFLTPHSFSVTLLTLDFRLFFILLQINYLIENKKRPRPVVSTERNPTQRISKRRFSRVYREQVTTSLSGLWDQHFRVELKVDDLSTL